MEHIICSSIMSFASHNDIFYALQHSFRNKRSCESQLLEFIEDVSHNMQNGHQTDVCMLDFSKAFDKVDHIRLIEKLKWYGSTNDWIKSLLTNRTHSVVLDGVASSSIHVTSGVLQGSVLGPCLFLFYINGIAQNLHSTTRLFADVAMIYMAMKNEMDAKLMQKDLDTLQNWENQWMMEFHPEKCEVISITRKRKPKIFAYTLHGLELKHVWYTKYLGVHITHNLRWDKQVL
ncbi:putative RNA-directed DNA polymerase from mobile element jockey-like [Apostichopus japonicus]|uniref:Putative RNA-directed DNA polymerase from mobile element jockey-like n=1 Tax=Stichopus japonicus TaxID=307972 RepID=A0A2G8JIE9_STIJA|nr:putative RNA-directed DNA polymerase from mobile element jockey-like [Apostichopus japonicus]